MKLFFPYDGKNRESFYFWWETWGYQVGANEDRMICGLRSSVMKLDAVGLCGPAPDQFDHVDESIMFHRLAFILSE